MTIAVNDTIHVCNLDYGGLFNLSMFDVKDAHPLETYPVLDVYKHICHGLFHNKILNKLFDHVMMHKL